MSALSYKINFIFFFIIIILCFSIHIQVHAQELNFTKSDAGEMPFYLKDPKKNLNNFEIDTNYPPFNKIIKNLSDNRNIQTEIKNNFCWGDCCGSSKKLTDKNNKISLYLFKSDCDEYGFSNNQYYFKNNILSIVRNFDFGIEEYPTETTPALWFIEEKLFIFNKNSVKIKERKKIFTDNNNYTINDINFNESTGDRSRLLKEKNMELKKYLELENSKE